MAEKDQKTNDTQKKAEMFLELWRLNLSLWAHENPESVQAILMEKGIAMTNLMEKKGD
ncbi:hypothetical protein QGN29_07535 [Temperatibacter marinus]|uniref:Uncharacterized protein n=1 Tax=Temperatibacter marinus TaxID=1456591 RepID=A0AA52ECY2_9PROT|nr:hypothetical protein [Temperatibacter marinus]WND01408.1 hypothetical protein QGN29_07535 [Temperatibacter marinus]